ncbi:MAG: patatin-like phospholipase family protein [Rhodocyclaceae bacterium]|nr:patatin-like phospholipase family protein [Rhodocyclaceae bacterium]
MAIEIGGVSKRIGLALSGGGFRAAGFHLGVMRKLRELQLLEKIDVISCVSGGSIAGAFVALNWTDTTNLDRLERYLASKSIAVSSFLAGALNPFESRLEALADSYDRDLFNSKNMSALLTGPRLYLNSTNLATGNMFSFVAGGGEAAEMGDYELGFVDAAEFPICKAVAASSAFPPVFPPLVLSTDVYSPGNEFEYISLTDGGVYDNMGIAPALNRRTKLDYLIVSDGGKPFQNDSQPTESGAMVLKAGLDIMMEQIRGLEFDRMLHRALANAGPRPMWFSIDSVEGAVDPADANFASSIKTDLRKLTLSELGVLQRHGGALVLSRIHTYAPELML